MNEHSFRNTIKTQAERFDPDMFVWKINDDYAGGVPDFFFERKDCDRWVEAKYIKRLPQRMTTLIDMMKESQYLSKLQQDWLKRRQETRGDVAVVVGIGEKRCEGVVVLLDFAWTRAYTTSEFIGMMVPPKDMFPALFQ